MLSGHDVLFKKEYQAYKIVTMSADETAKYNTSKKPKKCVLFHQHFDVKFVLFTIQLNLSII